MDRIYNLRKSNSKLCFQVDSYFDDEAESLKNSQDSEEFKLKNRSKSSMSNSKLQSCLNSHQSRRNYQARSLQEDQRTSCQSTSFPSEDISNPSMASINNNNNNTTESKKSKKSMKIQDKSVASLQKCLMKHLERNSAAQELLEHSKFFSLPQINLPVNCSYLQKQATNPIQENNLISIFSSLNETHSPLYATSNKNQQIVTLALRQNLSFDYLQNCPNYFTSQTSPQVLKKIIGFKDFSNSIQMKNSQIFSQKDQSSCLKEASSSDKQANIQQKASINSRKKNKVQSKYSQSQSILQLAENNKQNSFIIVENIKYQSQDDNSENKQIHIHISHCLLKQLGWDIQEFVDQVSFSGLPEIACTKNYESLIHSLMSLLTENTEQSSLCEKSVDTNDTSNFNSDKETFNAEMSLISCKGEVKKQHFYKLDNLKERERERERREYFKVFRVKDKQL